MGKILAIVCLPILAQAGDVAIGIPTFSNVIQFGSFGLMAYAIIWMLPRELAAARAERFKRDETERLERIEREKTSREERERRDTAYGTALQMQAAAFESRNSSTVNAVQNQTQELKRSFEMSALRVENAVVNVCRGSFQKSGAGTRTGDDPKIGERT